MKILQGEIHWVDFGEEEGSKATGVYPGLVVQRDAINKSEISTVVVCMITSTLKRADAPGNVLLLAGGETGLTENSVVNVSLITHVNKADFRGKMGTLNVDQMQEVFEGIQNLLRVPTFRL